MNSPIGLDAHTLLWLAASFVVSLVFTALAIGYARRKNVLDLPGQRRSHSVPTPRGGGVGIVISVALGLIVLPLFDPAMSLPLRLLAAVVLVALIGWIDDHRPLPAWLRLLVQVVAVGIWLTPVLESALHPHDAAAAGGFSEAAGVALLMVFLTLWSINLHNFMDGIDGLLALQALFVLIALGLLGLREDASHHPLQLGMWAAAVAGFVPFNFPRARVFMGDVGSAVLGLLIAAAVAWQVSMPEVAAASGAIAVSAFAVDATCTLLSRMLQGRRWYSAHREHLYQWLARSGLSHARVVALYMAWNLIVVAPVLWWINSTPETMSDDSLSMPSGAAWAAGVYTAGVALWICGKRWCARHARAVAAETVHASA